MAVSFLVCHFSLRGVNGAQSFRNYRFKSKNSSVAGASTFATRYRFSSRLKLTSGEKLVVETAYAISDAFEVKEKGEFWDDIERLKPRHEKRAAANGGHDKKLNKTYSRNYLVSMLDLNIFNFPISVRLKWTFVRNDG